MMRVARRRSSAWLEQGLHKAKVTGSNPVAAICLSTQNLQLRQLFFQFLGAGLRYLGVAEFEGPIPEKGPSFQAGNKVILAELVDIRTTRMAGGVWKCVCKESAGL